MATPPTMVMSASPPPTLCPGRSALNLSTPKFVPTVLPQRNSVSFPSGLSDDFLPWRSSVPFSTGTADGFAFPDSRSDSSSDEKPHDCGTKFMAAEIGTGAQISPTTSSLMQFSSMTVFPTTRSAHRRGHSDYFSFRPSKPSTPTAAAAAVASGSPASHSHQDLFMPPSEAQQNEKEGKKAEDKTTDPYAIEVLQRATDENLPTRFFLLLTAVISRISTAPSKDSSEGAVMSAFERYAIAFADAQDSENHGSGKGKGIAREAKATKDGVLYLRLWETTIEVVETVLATGEVGLDRFGWGVLGLSSGVLRPSAHFKSMRRRLRAALQNFPAQARYVHICANLLLQDMRNNWAIVRWWHLISVAERWVRAMKMDRDVDWDAVAGVVLLGGAGG